MLLLLTCALWSATPVAPPELAPTPSLAVAPQALGDERAADPGLRPLAQHDAVPDGSGDHADHMGPMLIVMGAMMAVMMAGMGAYFMRHHATATPASASTASSPAALALPVSPARPGGG